jgi:FtsH-binding integral membrane protein
MAQFDTMRSAAGVSSARIDAGLRAHMNKVYGTMSAGLFITFLAAWALSNLAVTSDPSSATVMIGEGKFLTSFGNAIYLSPLKWVIMLAPLAFIFGFGAAANRMPAAGVSLSSIFLVYTGQSIIQVFLITAISFAGLSLVGYTTKKDLSAMGAFLIMGLIGLIVASIVNMFMQSGAVAFAISVVGVLIFAGLTAYDTQKIKTTYLEMAHTGDQDWLGKAAIMGALSLYLDFINLFVMLLQLLGNRD